MSKAKQKEMEALRQAKQRREEEYRVALRRIIDGDERVRIALDYAESYLSGAVEAALEEYSPTQISRMVFEEQLALAKAEWERLPGGECRVEHFLAVMVRVMRGWALEEVPLYLVGLKEMFFEMAGEGASVRFEQFHRHIVGELVTLREEQQNTEFQVHLLEGRKQDYLLHDNGIRRALLSPDQRVTLALDHRETLLKVYDQDLRNTHRLQGRRELHGGKNPQIVDFDYSEMTMRLGLLFASPVLECLHLPNYLHRSQAEFEASSLNQLHFRMAIKMKRIYYVQMLNKWLTLSEDGLQVYLYDMEKARSKPEEVEEHIAIATNEMAISGVVEVVGLSAVCFVAGNEITFYNETLSELRFPRFSHHEIITNLKFSEEGSTFYLTGRQEKAITTFSIARNKTFKIATIPLTRVVVDFELFPHFEALLVADDAHELKLLHEPTRAVYQSVSLAHIVKNKDAGLRVQRTGKGEFMAFQTYLLNYSLERVAIEREVEYNFLPAHYFDARRQELFLSVNGQVLSFSLILGEVRRSYSPESSNIARHLAFFLGPRTPLFIVDANHYLYEVYLRGQEGEGENKNYKKKVALREVVGAFYDEEMRCVMLVGEDSVMLVRNDGNNNFNAVATAHLPALSRIAAATFCPRTKYLTLFSHTHVLYQLRNFETRVSHALRFVFPRAANDAEERVVVQVEYCSRHELLILLNNRNELLVGERLQPSNHVTVRLDDLLPYKLRHLAFTRFSYHLLPQRNAHLPSLLLYDDSGYLLDLQLHKLVTTRFPSNRKQEVLIRPFLNESYEVHGCAVEEVSVGVQRGRVGAGEFWVGKAHEKAVVLGTKLVVQVGVTLTVSRDGVIKLWNQSYSVLFVLKIPSLLKMTWNMKEIHDIKNRRSIGELRAIIAQHYSTAQPTNPLEAISKTRRIKHYVQPPKKFRFADELPLEIESKEVEDLLLQQEDYRKAQTQRPARPRATSHLAKTIDVHPWRHRREFQKIYERASPPHATKMPRDLLSLRTSLDMSERIKQPPNYRLAETLLPQLRAYENERPEPPKPQERPDQEDVENFESCLYIKSGRRRKKANELDQIDREFLKKEIALQGRRWIPRLSHQKPLPPPDLADSAVLPEDARSDTLRDIQSVFEEHNRECAELGRGRIIQIARINLIKDYA